VVRENGGGRGGSFGDTQFEKGDVDEEEEERMDERIGGRVPSERESCSV